MDGGQRRHHLITARQVVEPGDRHLLRHLDPHAVGLQQRALCNVVIAEKDGIHRSPRLEKRLELPCTQRQR
jgi:hypothetical protein